MVKLFQISGEITQKCMCAPTSSLPKNLRFQFAMSLTSSILYPWFAVLSLFHFPSKCLFLESLCLMQGLLLVKIQTRHSSSWLLCWQVSGYCITWLHCLILHPWKGCSASYHEESSQVHKPYRTDAQKSHTFGNVERK